MVGTAVRGGIVCYVPMIVVLVLVHVSHLMQCAHVVELKGVEVHLFERGVAGAKTHGPFNLIARFVVVTGFENTVGKPRGGDNGCAVYGRSRTGKDNGNEANDGGEDSNNESRERMHD